MKTIITIILSLILTTSALAAQSTGAVPILAGVATASPPAPTLTSATVGTLGLYADLAFSENLVAGANGGGGWSMTCPTTGTITMTPPGVINSSTLAYSLSTPPLDGETCTVSYTQPGNGLKSDETGVDLASFSGAAVDNQSAVQPSGPGSTSVLDNFNRADVGPPPSASWATLFATAGHRVASNQLESVEGYYIVSQWNTSFNANVEAYITLQGTALYCMLGVRWDTDVVNGYSARYDDGVLSLVRWDANTGTTLGATVNQTLAAGDGILIEAIGSTIKLYTKVGAGAWTEKISRPDSTYSAGGKTVIGTWNTSDKYDDFGGGNR